MNDPRRILQYIIVGSFCFVMNAVALVLLVGLFFPSVDNKDIFPILKEYLGTITGALIVLLTQGLSSKSNVE